MKIITLFLCLLNVGVAIYYHNFTAAIGWLAATFQSFILAIQK